MDELWAAIQALPPAQWLRDVLLAYILVNAAHIASLGLLVGCIVTLDLRLLGAFASVPLPPLWTVLSRMAAAGLMLAALTGLWLFSVNAEQYAHNRAFQLKLGLLALAVANAALLHWRMRPRSGPGSQPNSGTKLQAAASIALWLSVLLAGRWIGFA